MTPSTLSLPSPLQARKGFLGIYVHYPYCYKKCDYCDFYSEGIGKDPSSNEEKLFYTYKQEFLSRKNKSSSMKSDVIDTIFIGGGTPSKALAKNWKDLILFFKNEINVSDSAEISLEANPEDLSNEYIDELYAAGINRLNVGVQTRSESGLHFLGRHVDIDKYENLGNLFAQSKIKRLGIDLMYGMPNLSKDIFFEDLDFFLNMNLKHLSLYSLTLEKGTAYSRKVKESKMKAPNEEIQREILEYLPRKMAAHGYHWYEVSNYCQPNEFSRHNLRYWMYEPYLGLGPGAHGFLDGFRYGNARNSESYLKFPDRAKLESSSPKEEIALSLFRLFIPFEPITFFQLHLSESETAEITKQIEKMEKKGYCLWDGKTFQWKTSALFILDDLIFDLTQVD